MGKNCKVFPVHKLSHVGGSRSNTPHILKLYTRCRHVVSYTPRQLFWWDSLNRRLGVPQNWAGCFGEEKVTLAFMGNQNQGCPAYINPLNSELNSICHLLTLLGTHHILHVSRIRVKVTVLTTPSQLLSRW